MSYSLYILVDPRNDSIFYVGISTCPKNRFRQHNQLYPKDWKSNPFKCRTIKEIKDNGFMVVMNIISEFDSLQKCKEAEIDLINTLKESLTNITPGGDYTAWKGRKHTNEWKRQQSKRLSGVGNPNFGKTIPEWHKKLLSERMKISAPNKGAFGEKHPRSKKVQQFDFDGNLVATYGSAREAARSLNKTSNSEISKCCNNQCKTAYGFIWKYLS